MKARLTSKQFESAFFEDKYMIGLRYPGHFSDFVTQIYHHLALNFVNTGSPIHYIQTQSTDAASSSLFGSTASTEDLYYQVFRAQDPTDNTEHILYENRIGTSYLIQSKENIDYIWLVSDINEPEKYLNELIRKINTIPDVQIAMSLIPEKLKNLSYLIL